MKKTKLERLFIPYLIIVIVLLIATPIALCLTFSVYWLLLYVPICIILMVVAFFKMNPKPLEPTDRPYEEILSNEPVSTKERVQDALDLGLIRDDLDLTVYANKRKCEQINRRIDLLMRRV